MTPRVLIGYSACELTRAAFHNAGVEAWTCDLLPSRGTNSNYHIQGDVWDAIRSRQWDMGIFHPMCTYLTVSAAWAYKDGPYHQKVSPGTLVGRARCAARDAALDNFRALLTLPFPVVIENPAPSFVNRAIRPPDQVIQPHQFGDDASKSTGLWLTRGVPLLRATGSYPPRIVNGKPRWSNQTDSGQNRLSPGDDRWLERSKTYPGIAAAIGAQYGAWLRSRPIVRLPC